MIDSYFIAQLLTYVIFLIAVVAYIVFDGFDLGVGCLHLFAKGNQERRIMLNSIGPFWDSNSIWIIIVGGVLFAGFTKVFSILTPNLYTPIMLMIFGFILRITSLEFRSKIDARWWKATWDTGFFLASFLLALLLGTILGNLIQGLPINDQGELVGGLFAILTPYPLLVAIFGIACFMMHGALYLLMKTENDFQKRVLRWAKATIYAFLIFWFITTITTFISQTHMLTPFKKYPLLIVAPLLSFVTIAGIVHSIQKHKYGLSFLFSSLTIVCLLLLFVIGTCPNIAYSTIDPEKNSLTFMNSSASQLALWILIAVALTGVPLGFVYIAYLYRSFRGKVKIDHMSY